MVLSYVLMTPDSRNRAYIEKVRELEQRFGSGGEALEGQSVVNSEAVAPQSRGKSPHKFSNNPTPWRQIHAKQKYISPNEIQHQKKHNIKKTKEKHIFRYKQTKKKRKKKK